jgi:hypothetical protein
MLLEVSERSVVGSEREKYSWKRSGEVLSEVVEKSVVRACGEQGRALFQEDVRFTNPRWMNL